jgi:hypothetical protein
MDRNFEEYESPITWNMNMLPTDISRRNLQQSPQMISRDLSVADAPNCRNNKDLFPNTPG